LAALPLLKEALLKYDEAIALHKKKKKGAFPSWTGNSSYEMIEVDDSGNPIMKEMAHDN